MILDEIAGSTRKRVEEKKRKISLEEVKEAAGRGRLMHQAASLSRKPCGKERFPLSAK